MMAVVKVYLTAAKKADLRVASMEFRLVGKMVVKMVVKMVGMRVEKTAVLKVA